MSHGVSHALNPFPIGATIAPKRKVVKANQTNATIVSLVSFPFSSSETEN